MGLKDRIRKFVTDLTWKPQIHIEAIPLDGDGNKIAWGDSPKQCSCPHCNNTTTSFVQEKARWKAFLVGGILLWSAGWIGLLLLLFVWPLLRDYEHICTQCNGYLGVHSRLSFPEVRREIVTLKAGNCAIVLSRRYFIFVGLIIGLIIFFYIARLYVGNFGTDLDTRGPFIEKEWTDFLNDCGMKSQIGNPIRAMRIFESTYRGKTVRWRGLVHSIHEGVVQNNMMTIRMSPAQHYTQTPDLGLIFQPRLYEAIEKVQTGDLIEFETTLLHFGKRGQPHIGSLWDCKLIERHSEPADTSGVLGMMLRLVTNQNSGSRLIIIPRASSGQSEYSDEPQMNPYFTHDNDTIYDTDPITFLDDSNE